MFNVILIRFQWKRFNLARNSSKSSTDLEQHMNDALGTYSSAFKEIFPSQKIFVSRNLFNLLLPTFSINTTAVRSEQNFACFTCFRAILTKNVRNCTKHRPNPENPGTCSQRFHHFENYSFLVVQSKIYYESLSTKLFKLL